MADDVPKALLAVGFVRNAVGLAIWIGITVALIGFGDWLARLIGLAMLGIYAIPLSVGVIRWARGRSA